MANGIIFTRAADLTSFRYGAHDLSPIDDFTKSNPFEHYSPILQRISSPNPVSSDFSNIDEVVTTIKNLEGL